MLMKSSFLICLYFCFITFSKADPLAAKKNHATFNVKSYGALADGKSLDTQAIQSAIDKCSAEGGGVVRLPAGRYIVGTIELKSDVTLSLDYGAFLLGSLNKADYPSAGLIDPREGAPHTLLYAENAKNIRIEGLGVIDGRGNYVNFPRKDKSGNRLLRPRLLRFENCQNLIFSGVTYKNPAFWGLHLIDCKDITFSAITINFIDNNYNNDGIDLDGCENVLIENSTIHAGDDAICLKSSLHPCKNILVRNCVVSSHTAALKFGTSSSGGFINIEVSNCYFHDCPLGAIKLQCVDGGRLENVKISRIKMENVGAPIFIRLGNRGRNFTESRKGNDKIREAKPQGAPIGVVENIRFEDIDARVSYKYYVKRLSSSAKNNKLSPNKHYKAKGGPIMITGIPGSMVENVKLKNVKITYPGGVSSEELQSEVPEDIARYPEQYFFGMLPAWGAYVRHSKNVTFENVTLVLAAEDDRKKIVLDNVINFQERQ